MHHVKNDVFRSCGTSHVIIPQLLSSKDFSPFLRCMDGVCQKVVCSFVRSLVRSVRKCTIMYYEQTAGPNNANFYKHMHFDKEPLSNNFHPNPQCP